jgi:hypothetical protein
MSSCWVSTATAFDTCAADCDVSVPPPIILPECEQLIRTMIDEMDDECYCNETLVYVVRVVCDARQCSTTAIRRLSWMRRRWQRGNGTKSM